MILNTSGGNLRKHDINKVSSNNVKQLPSMEDFIEKRDYSGALNLLEFQHTAGVKHTTAESSAIKNWIGFCYFHLGEHNKALLVYETINNEHNDNDDDSRPNNNNNNNNDNLMNLTACHFFLGMYSEIIRMLEGVTNSTLKTRLQFHLAHKLNDDVKLMQFHEQLFDIIEDQLSLASVHYLRAHYQEAIDIYKRILVDNKDYLALNVYMALCYYKLDYYDVSQDILGIYLHKYPESITATNLKACNYFRVYNGKVAEAEIKLLLEKNISSFPFGQDLLRHNLVVFRDGESALQIFPSLINVIPEARFNLAIYYLRKYNEQQAYDLIKHSDPSVPYEYILKAIVYTIHGQENKIAESIRIAQQLFKLVGSSSSECDTIPGRQCMASAYFLQQEFREVQLYLSSIRSYYFKDDCFNFNLAQTKAALGNYKEAEELFMQIQNNKIINDYVYVSQLSRCFIMNKKPQSAWELYLKMETCSESLNLLQLIANECYRMAQFWHAAKAFDMLERLDPIPEYWEGKRGACIGVLQLIIAGRQARDTLLDVIQLLRNSVNMHVESIIRTIKMWAKENRINI